MSRRATCIALAVLAACGALVLPAAPAAAAGTRVVDQHGRPVGGTLKTWIDRAKVPLPSGRIQIRRGTCPGYGLFVGCVFTRRPRVIYLRPTLREPRRTLYHELGHVFDMTVLNNRERRRFKRILGIHRSGWFGGALPPSEWFGDGYALCAMRSSLTRRPRRTPYGYAPSPRAHARVCRLIRAAAEPLGRRPTRPANPPPVAEVAPPPPEQTDTGGCTLVDQLLTGCTPPPPPPSAPPPPPVVAPV